MAQIRVAEGAEGFAMGRKCHSKESIVQTLQNLAKRLNKESLTKQEVQTVIPTSSIGPYFGSVGKALEAAGLQQRSNTEHLKDIRRQLTDEELFRSLLEAERSLGHEPGATEYISNGRYSARPFKRFGRWPDVLAYYRKWKSDTGIEVVNAITITELDKNPQLRKSNSTRVAESREIAFAKSSNSPSQLYGEPIDFRGLRHAPINEQGVVYLFGMVSRELGFYIEAIQQGFPDCEGKYLHDASKNLWAKARIEFEFKASNFREHGHDPNQCDFIVCWINDWEDCPITVIELRHEILKLPNVGIAQR